MQNSIKYIALLFAVFIFSKTHAQCTAEAGIPVAPLINYDGGVNTPSDLIVTNYSLNPSGTSDHGFFITEGSGTNAPIVSFTDDGSWDFSGAIDGTTYCFTGFAYSQTELDIITNNQTIQILIPSGCLMGGENVEEYIDCLNQNFPVVNIHNSIDSVLSQIVPLVVPQFVSPNNPPCFDIATTNESYCVTYTSGTTDPCDADAGISVFPSISEYIPGYSSPSDLLVTNFIIPPSGTTDFGFVITDGSGTDQSIVGFTDDGTWDFAGALPNQEYCFTTFAYNQSELDSITFNQDVQDIFTVGCLQGGETMTEFVNCILQQFPQSATIDEVENTLNTIFPSIVPAFQPPNFPPCFDFGNFGQYCITYDPACEPLLACDDNDPNTDYSIYDENCDCVGLPNQDPCDSPNAGDPVFPLETFCSYNTAEDLIVSNYNEMPSGSTDFSFIVTADEEFIIGVSDDGSYPIDYDYYAYLGIEEICFTPFANNAADAQLFGAFLSILYDYNGDYGVLEDCIISMTSWEELIVCANEFYYYDSGMGFEEFQDLLDYQVYSLISDYSYLNINPLCYDLGETHCVSICSFEDFDEDGDGVSNGFEDVNGNGDYEDDDTDEDGIPDYLDTDDDGDGILTMDEDLDNDGDFTNDDTDQNNVPNYLDNDDDGDLVLTFLEDVNDNGNLLDDDTDLDGIPNYLDTDDDGDGILTMDEDTNENGLPWDDDVDTDGIPDYLDDDVVNIEDFNKFSFNIYPNPNNGIFTIDVAVSNFEVIVYNEYGAVVYKAKNKNSIDLKNAASGVYSIQILTTKGSTYSNFIVE